MKRMLFNATQAEELRVAIVDGQKLIDLDIESAAKEQRKSNIYKAVITRIEPSLEAAFVDYGAERHGFLPFKEVSRAYFREGVEPNRATIKEALKEGQELIVQVDKDERGNKGAALTTFISLAGRYLVLMPNNPRGGGVSRRIEGEDRNELRETMDQLDVPQGMSLIARTAGIGRGAEELQWDLNYLMQLWRAIEGAAGGQKGPFLIYQEGSLVIRAIRDYFQPDIGEILIDTDDIYEQAQQFMSHVMPGNVARVKRYRDDVPLFSRFQIEHQIETAFGRQVTLPSGGAIVVDHTEALVAVDVNSGRATRGADIEETALRTNLEAADEIARQLRLRDLGGLIVIDFIDMESPRAQREVENRLRDALHYDRARVQTGKISRFGLMELSRQRLRPALAEMTYIPCPRCTGTGHIRSTESAALHILRILEEEAMKENTGAVHVQIPVDVATFLLNEKRDDIRTIELRHKVNLVLIPNIHLETPAHEIVRLRHDQLNLEDQALPSYKMVEAPPTEAYQPPSAQTEARPGRPEAAVKGITPAQPAPVVEPKPAAAPVAAAPSPAQPGIIDKIFGWFRGNRQAEPVPEEKSVSPARREREPSREGRGERDRGRGRGGRGERGERGERGRQEPRERQEQQRGQQPRPEQEARGERRPRQERSERPERGERGEKQPGQEARQTKPARQPAPRQAEAPAAHETGALESPIPGTETQQEERRGRRSRRGRGRDRGERRSEGQPAEVQESGTIDLAEADNATPVAEQTQLILEAATPAATEVEPAEAAPAPVPLAVEVLAVETAAAETAEAPVLVVDTPLKAAPAPAPAVAIEPVAIPAEPPAPPKPQVDLGVALQESGLVMVETSRDKAPAAIPAEPEIRLGRKPKPPVALNSEPMQQVETRK
ncbi:MAG: Rne/Rng family ribonuclease [Rhodocyclaceae bacterium]|jgi:ribonuclease E|nr:Rne/Rng family ribonuclease [Rhodocyclaceae bacterium]MCL4681226.1 Rne/Rng family ribonuclease [Rhodocyclaceae bacterium]